MDTKQMTEDEKKEFFTKFTKVVGKTTKHYEYSDIDPLQLYGWIESLLDKKLKEQDESHARSLLGLFMEESILDLQKARKKLRETYLKLFE